VVIGVIIASELPHRPLASCERLKTLPHQGVDQPLTGEAPPSLLGDGIQHIVDLQFELLLHAIFPLGLSNRGSAGEQWHTPLKVLNMEPFAIIIAGEGWERDPLVGRLPQPVEMNVEGTNKRLSTSSRVHPWVEHVLPQLPVGLHVRQGRPRIS
jgi:hypothetical protein